jgi:hypothetical protein
MMVKRGVLTAAFRRPKIFLVFEIYFLGAAQTA